MSADAGRPLGEDVARHAQAAARAAPADTLSPAQRYQELFEAVQTQRVFADSKTFVDCAPLADPDDILEDYRAHCEDEGFDLAAFVHAHFRPEHPPRSAYVSDPDRTLTEHIDGLWDVLTRVPREHPTRSSLLPLPHRYVVPGGRFGEIYYWDSYFTMLGLCGSGRHDLLRAMADDFAYLIDTYGHVPNGNRSYYLSRSQPPVFALMTELFEEQAIDPQAPYLPRLRKEHAFWMEGAEHLAKDEVHCHCARMPDGSLLNRYWDTRDIPREEAWLEDVETAKASGRPAHDVYRDLRAAAASGWDFSSRWCDGDALSGIRTTRIVPVDLNAFLFKLESRIAVLAARVGDEAAARRYTTMARERRAAVDRWLWSETLGTYADYDLDRGRTRDALTAAIAVPLFVGMSGDAQAARTAAALESGLLAPGGLGTTQVDSGEQWDRPNGWAPLQWMAIQGLLRYGHGDLACRIRERWLRTVGNLYEREAKLVEKYALRQLPEHAEGGGGGEYPLQDGFGWTNGVTRRLLDDDPAHPCRHSRAGKARG